MNRSKGLFSLLVALLLLVGSSTDVLAAKANKKFIELVRNEFINYEAKTTKKYNTYREEHTKKFEDYNKIENGSLKLFVTQTEKDLITLDELLKQDLNQLKNQFANNKDYDTKLRDYESKINQYGSNSPMNNYKNSINQYHSKSYMYRYANAINQYSSNAPMYKYSNAINQYSSNSPMIKYSNAVNRYSSGSPMIRLDNGSSIYSSNSIMNNYNRGKITKKEAEKQWKALLKKEDENIQKVITQTNKDLSDIEKDSKSNILKQKYETVNGILKQREQTLQTINETRFEYFGEGISFQPLIPSLGDINVMFNKEWLALEQPPVVKNSYTIVPMRAIFEKLGAEVKSNPKTKTITATKQNIEITLSLDKKSAVINGKTVTLDTPPTIIGGHTMVPLQLVSALGAEVKWDVSSQTVFITN